MNSAPIRRVKFRFRLYVAGGTQNSVEAVVNLTTLCKTHLPNRHDIEIVDVFREPRRALEDGILMTPTLVKLTPAPVWKIVGTLSHALPIMQALGLESVS